MAPQKEKPDTAAEAEKSETALREEAVLAFWREHDTFEKSLKKPAPEGEFVFYDGPPFATGLPHYGHILPTTIKDAIPRYQTMRGKHVRRKWGWDCHGLPLENLIETELGLKTKKDIEEHGVEKFNEAARAAVLRYADEWRKTIPRVGRWVDMEDDYRTMDPSYTESVWWVFSELHKKGLVYEGFKSMHLCPRCGTTLSNFEVNQGYQDIKDIAVTVKLPLLDDAGNPTDTSLLVWTTTPWTLPGNMAAAVHNDFDYVKVKITNSESGSTEHVILAKERLAQLGTDAYEVVETFVGRTLVGRSYVPPFSYYTDRDIENKAHAWKIYHAPYVEIGDEGTGAVHLAPAYGEEDMELAKEYGIPVVHHVGEDGRFLPHVTDFAGEMVKPRDDTQAGISHLDTDIKILRHLQENGQVIQKENITHSYPHCWRCDTPLLNYATTSWFVEVTKIRDTLVEENKKIHWVPEHVGSSRFGKWLEGARDWAVSRQRYWGAPLPIWRNPETKEITVIDSLAALKAHTPKSGNTYVLMRHAQAESNAHNVCSHDVSADDPLTAVGTEQIEREIPALKEHDIDVIIASPFMRTRTTAERVAEGIGYDPEAIVFDERIAEIQSGFHGRPISEYHAFLDKADAWYSAKTEDGESWEDVKQRVGAFLYDIEATYRNKNILIVAHNSPLRMLRAVSAGASLSGTPFNHDGKEKRFAHADSQVLHFTPLPHNRSYELDLHRPYIDETMLMDADGTTLERVPDVFDCWFESGSMPYGQMHYPFANTEVFDPEKQKGYPADFIAESIDQTRGWFYSLIVLGTALFGRAPYKNVITNGLVLAEDGKKMSKKLKNYPDPLYVANTYGVDTMRFYLLSSSIMRGEDLHFSETQLAELSRKNIGRLHNVLAFYDLYRDAAVAPSHDSGHVLDRWIVARTHELLREVTDGFENYEIDRATRPITDFIDDLSVWYVRRSRDRLKETGTDARAALATLRYVLGILAHIIAPAMPFYAEHLFRAVRSDEDPESVHLSNWPEAGDVDEALISEMAAVREVVSAALEERTVHRIKVRQPLRTLRVQSAHLAVAPELIPLIEDEVNVKEVVVDGALSEMVALDTTLTPELKSEGAAREFIRHVQALRKKAGLTPGEQITLGVTTNDAGRRIIDAHGADIRQTTNATEITYRDDLEEGIKVDDIPFGASLER